MGGARSSALGEVIISRNYRGEVPMNVTERFHHNVIDADDAMVKPVFCEESLRPTGLGRAPSSRSSTPW